jgi:uncharacterized protein YabN with tetrapyrrole methylase and pyrophosphatase domain
MVGRSRQDKTVRTTRVYTSALHEGIGEDDGYLDIAGQPNKQASALIAGIPRARKTYDVRNGKGVSTEKSLEHQQKTEEAFSQIIKRHEKALRGIAKRGIKRSVKEVENIERG